MIIEQEDDEKREFYGNRMADAHAKLAADLIAVDVNVAAAHIEEQRQVRARAEYIAKVSETGELHLEDEQIRAVGVRGFSRSSKPPANDGGLSLRTIWKMNSA